MFNSADVKILLLCVFLNVSLSPVHSQVSGKDLCSCFPWAIVTIVGWKPQSSDCPSISICSQTHITVRVVMHRQFHGAILGICLSVKLDFLTAMGGLHLRYLQLYEDQASCLGWLRRPTICPSTGGCQSTSWWWAILTLLPPLSHHDPKGAGKSYWVWVPGYQQWKLNDIQLIPWIHLYSFTCICYKHLHQWCFF